MHPEISSAEPGSCPICGMDLVRKEAAENKKTEVGLGSLLKPANAFIAATIPVTAIQKRTEPISFNVVGHITYDTRNTGIISSTVKGRIERLYVRYKYKVVKKGQRILDIYSPDLLTAQQNFIFLLKNDPENVSLQNAAAERLILMGLTRKQVSQLAITQNPVYALPVFSNYSGYITDPPEIDRMTNPMSQPPAGSELTMKEGMYVQGGQAIFSVNDPSKALILLDIFPEQQFLIKAGTPVIIKPETAPHQKFRGNISYVEPVFRPGTKTLSARVYFNNKGMQLPIGSRVYGEITGSTSHIAWLPREAILSLGRSRIVFLKVPGGFKAHEVSTGLELNNAVQVTSGLSVTDSVAANAQFLADNEAFIKTNGK